MAIGCGWYGKPIHCSDKCPTAYELISLNSHPGGAKSGCQTGHFSSFCCRRVEVNLFQMMACPASNLGNALSNGLSPRFKDVQDIFNRAPYAISEDSDLVTLGTGEECAYEAGKITAGEGAIGSVGRLGQVYAIPNGVIPNFLPGVWLHDTGGQYTLKPISNRVYPTASTILSCSVSTTETSTFREWTSTKTATCDGGSYPQACQHYRSVISVQSATVLSCAYPLISSRTTPRPELTLWNGQHTRDWISWIPTWGTMSKKKMSGINSYCERDEYPPALFLQGTGGANMPAVSTAAYIRFLPQAENGGAGQLWWKACDKDPKSSEGQVQGGNVIGGTCYCAFPKKGDFQAADKRRYSVRHILAQ